jgi:TonB family protein
MSGFSDMGFFAIYPDAAQGVIQVRHEEHMKHIRRILSCSVISLGSLALLCSAQETQPPPATDPANQSTQQNSGTYLTKAQRANLKPPKVLHTVKPVYPKSARKLGIGGMYLVSVVIDQNGQPQHAHIVRSPAYGTDPIKLAASKELEGNAIEAVENYSFAPAIYQGHPVPIEINIEVEYR